MRSLSLSRSPPPLTTMSFLLSVVGWVSPAKLLQQPSAEQQRISLRPLWHTQPLSFERGQHNERVERRSKGRGRRRQLRTDAAISAIGCKQCVHHWWILAHKLSPQRHLMSLAIQGFDISRRKRLLLSDPEHSGTARTISGPTITFGDHHRHCRADGTE